MSFENKTAIVTGGTGGLGRFVVNRFAEVKMNVYVPVRSIDEFKKVFDNSQTTNAEQEFKLKKIYGLQCDALSEAEVKQFISDVIKREGKIDYLINTVGGYHPKKMLVDMESDLVDKMMDLNLKCTFFFCKNVLGDMIANDFGRIVAIASMPAVEITPGRFAYSVSKAGVVNLIQTIAEEYKANNITANVVVPSVIDTSANRASMPKAEFDKWVKPEDIAETILFLVSDFASSYRGNVIKMYGKV